MLLFGVFDCSRATAQPATAHDERGPCKKAMFDVFLQGGHPYSREIGQGLAFTMNPLNLSATEQEGGWWIQVTPKDNNQHDYSLPLNPPFRSLNSQYLATAYGVPVRELLSEDHKVRFMLSPAEYERIHQLMWCSLWPCKPPQPRETAGEYLDAIKRAPSGLISVHPKQSRTSSDGLTVDWARLSISVIVPKNFELAPDLVPTNESCPAGVVER